jgi:hypothetical protein
MAHPEKIFHQLPCILRKQPWRAVACARFVRNNREWKDFVAWQFPNAWEALQRASLHGRVGDYAHDFIVHFNRFRNFSHDRFLATIRHPAATAEGISEWIADGMICSRGWPTNTTRLPMEAPRG